MKKTGLIGLISKLVCVALAIASAEIPIWAQENNAIVIQAEDYSSASQKPSEGTANINGTSEKVLKLNSGQWLEYAFTVEYDGEYEMYVQSASKDNVGVAIFIDGALCPISVFAASGSPLKYARQLAGSIDIGSGEHILRVENADAVGIDKFELIKTSDDGTRIKVQFEEYAESNGAISVISAGTGKSVEAEADSSLRYSISIPERAKYTLSIYAASEKKNTLGLITGSGREYSFSCEATGGQSKFVLKKVGDICLLQGTQIITINTAAVSTLDYFILEKSGEFDADVVSDSYSVPAAEYSASSEEKPVFEEDGFAVVLPASEWLEYSVKADAEEAYAVYVEGTAGTAATVSISLNGELIDSALIQTEVTEICHMILPKGSNVIRVTADGNLNVRKVRLEKLVPGYGGGNKDALKVEFEDYGPGGEGIDYHDSTEGLDADYYINRGDDVETAYGGSGIVLGGGDGEWWRYYVDIPSDGTYILTISHASISGASTMLTFEFPGGVEREYAIQPTGAWDPMTNDEVGTVELKAGSGVIKVSQSGGGVNWDYFRLDKINTDFDVYSVFAGEKALVNGRTIERGTDFFTAYCTDEINTDALYKASAYVINGDEIIPAELSASGNELDISLKGTLDYSTVYTLVIKNLESKYACAKQKSIIFATSDIQNDNGGGSLSISDKNISYENVDIAGVVYSSVGQKVSGRSVTLSVTAPDGTYTDGAVKTVSGEGGTFEISYTIPEGSAAGRYIFTLATEYTTKTAVAELVYISQVTEKAILDNLRAAGSVSEVREWFDKNSQILGITHESDLESIPEADMFYRHFINADYAGILAFCDDYNKYLAFETINQGDITAVEGILADSVLCGYIGIDGAKSDGIVKHRAEFLSELASLEDMKTPVEYKAEYDRICNNRLAEEFGKTDVMPDVQSISVYAGQGVNIPIAFTKGQTGVKKISYIIECEKSGLFGNVTTSGISGSKEIKNTDNTAVVTVDVDESSDPVIKIGTVILTAPGYADSYTLKVSGSIEYKVSSGSRSYDITRSILNKDIVVTVTKKSSDDGAGKGSSSSTSSGGSSMSQITIQPQDVQSYSFGDLQSVKWAEESINYLLKKNIVSENEERLFYPDRNITREEFVKMIVTAVGAYTADAQTQLVDVRSDEWYYSYIASAEKYGIIYGKDGSFGVGENITRQDMAAIIYRTLEKLGYTAEPDGSVYADDGEISEYAKAAVYCVKALNIMSGVGDNRCAPKDFATRAMAARMIYEMMKAVGR